MTSYLMKLIGGILAVILLAFVPLVTKVCIDEIEITRKGWNYLENYVDTVTDKGLLTEDDYEDFVRRLSANGVIYDVDIEVSRKIALPESEGTAEIIYQPVGFYSSSPNESYQILIGKKALYKGDIITVTCTPVNSTTGQVMVSKFTRSTAKSETFSLSGMVRNNGVGG